ncbi:hypothetical protein B0H67DRAFT_497679 [Lasiosphaeris hirsuta]|uniref:Chromosome transmission fidelity protein 4 n=1 Tax=Lasiosphaeris hirsuta TaxID=260670 RepID=A0AA39ZX88_9PEZI|nr:hypothetical protein B0H67DRAFT_497679 [Lasiosphaeris hirsuta]
MAAPTKILRRAQAWTTASQTASRAIPVLPSSQSPSPSPTPTPSTPKTTSNNPDTSRGPNRQHPQSIVWFNSSFPRQSEDLSSEPPSSRPPENSPDKSPNGNRKAKLGKTLRILQSRLPTLLQTPLPQEILSRHISLHLFPSTHPHLPVVSGRVAYVAALWSSPIAWGRVPIVGNVRLDILSARMVDRALSFQKRPKDAVGEQLVVRWRTIGGKGRDWGSILPLSFINGNGKGSSDAAAKEGAATDSSEHRVPVGDAQPAGDTSKEFTGLFIFDFDAEGRVLSHTIEHVHQNEQWEKGVGAKVVGLTDWLLGGMKSPNESPCPAFSRKEK